MDVVAVAWVGVAMDNCDSPWVLFCVILEGYRTLVSTPCRQNAEGGNLDDLNQLGQ